MRPRRSPWRKALKALTALGGSAALMLDVHQARTQTPFDLYRERVAMSGAGVRCRLFDAETAAALAAGVAQARTAALRAGYGPEALDHGSAEARAQAARPACTSPACSRPPPARATPSAPIAASERMAFPGQAGGRRLDRIMPRETAAWRLAQDAFAGEDRVVFGLSGLKGTESVTLSVASADGATPYAARLLVRDAARLPQPVLPADSSAALATRAPLRSAAKVILADARSPADPALRPIGAEKAVAFRFPPSARQDLERLDPREAVSVEILYPSDRGDLVRTAFLEVGDFDAGMAFLNTQAR